MGVEENLRDWPSRWAVSHLRMIACRLQSGSGASRTRRSVPCLCSNSMVRRLLSQMPSTAMWASSRISIPQTHGKLPCATKVMEAVEDISTKVAATLFLSDEEKKTQRKALLEGPLPFYLSRLQQRLEAHGGRYFSADRLTVADLKVFVWVRHLKSGVLDHIPADLPDRIAPKLVEHYERVKNDQRVQAYYDKHGIAA
jgi:hypothetical protein